MLRTARLMLADPERLPLTLSALAAEAQVSRRTLYVHWGTIQQVISDAVTFEATDILDATGLSPRDTLRGLLEELRTRLGDPVTRVALVTMLTQATQAASAATVVEATAIAGLGRFSAMLGEMTAEQYGQLVGPVLFAQFVLLKPASDELLDSLVEQGARILGLDAEAR